MKTEDLKVTLRKKAVEKFGEEKVVSIEKQHPGVSLIEIGDKMAFFKTPDRKILSAAISLGANDPVKYAEMLAENCYVDGDKELLSDDAYFIPLMPYMDHLLSLKTGHLVKL